MKKAATNAEKEHMAQVKKLPCIICYERYYDYKIKHYIPMKEHNSEYDHLVDGNRLGHMFGLPLCHAHHEGKKRYGNPAYYWDTSKPNQWRLLEKVYAVLGKEVPQYNPKINNFRRTNADN